MATKVHMEALSPTMEEGQIVKWLKSEGDEVSNGEILAEIETDKATMELVARGDGILRRILLPEGKAAPIGEVIAVIAAADEDISAFGGGGDAAGSEAASGDEGESKKGADRSKGDGKESDEAGDKSEKAARAEQESSATSDSATDAEKSADDSGAADSSSRGGRVKASPVARRLAEDEGVELSSVRGSGPGGRIVKRDVEEAARAAPAGSAAPSAPAFAPRFTAPESEEDYRDLPLSQMRKTIAKRLVESIGPVPHFFLTIDVDMTRAVEARAKVNALLEAEKVKVSFNDIVLKATAISLRRHPECNAHWGGDHVRQFHRVHLGVAVAIEDGLITPIIRDAHLKGLAEIALEVRELAGRARQKKLKPEEYTGATCSVSNLGMFGIEHFTAVINPPEAAILAVGALEERAVVVDGEVRVQPRMKITMSCDHRVIDGAQAAAFLKTLRAILEEPLAGLA